MKCPVCTTTELVMSERQGIEIDYCPACRGVWLDRGELDKLIDRSSSPGAGTAMHDVRRGERQDFDNASYKQRKKKSLLGEILDF